MRTAVRFLLVVIIIVHGLIHLLGTAKGFGWADVTTLKRPISRRMAVGWLLAAVFVVGSGVLLAANVHLWRVAAMAAAAMSQAVIFRSWNDAKAGAVANAILLFTAGYDALTDGLTTPQS